MDYSKKRNIKRNNKGTSLVELLVSIVILSMVIVPLLTSFVVSAKMNAKAKEVHNATMLAQNVMEGLKIETIESLELQYDLLHKENGSITYEIENAIMDNNLQFNVKVLLTPMEIEGVTAPNINYYDVEIMVFKSGSDTKIAVISGSMRN